MVRGVFNLKEFESEKVSITCHVVRVNTMDIEERRGRDRYRATLRWHLDVMGEQVF